MGAPQGKLSMLVLLASALLVHGVACDDGIGGDGGAATSACNTCQVVFEERQVANEVCRGESEDALTDLIACFCSSCRAECLSNACQGEEPEAGCLTCIEASCGTEEQACLAN